MLGYIITLIVAGVKASRAGGNIWLSNVEEIQQAEGPTNHEKGIPDPTMVTHPLGSNCNYGIPPVLPHSKHHCSSTAEAPSMTTDSGSISRDRYLIRWLIVFCPLGRE